jgi:hypothetical protein
MLLPAIDLLVAQQRRAQHVCDGQFAVGLVERRQQADHFGVLALPEPAVGEHQNHLRIGGLGRVQGRQFPRRVRNLPRLVKSQREIQPNARIFRPALQRRLILHDGFGVAPSAGHSAAPRLERTSGESGRSRK